MTELAAVDDWLTGMLEMLAAWSEGQALEEVMREKLCGPNKGDEVAKMLLGAKLRQWGAPPHVITACKAIDRQALQSLGLTAVQSGTEGAPALLEKLAAACQLNTLSEIARPILHCQLTIRGVPEKDAEGIVDRMCSKVPSGEEEESGQPGMLRTIVVGAVRLAAAANSDFESLREFCNAL